MPLSVSSLWLFGHRAFDVQNKQFFRTFPKFETEKVKKTRHMFIIQQLFRQKTHSNCCFLDQKVVLKKLSFLTLTCPPARTRNCGSTGIFVGKQKKTASKWPLRDGKFHVTCCFSTSLFGSTTCLKIKTCPERALRF